MYESKQFSTREMAATLGVTQRTIYNRLGPMNLDTTSLPRRHHAPVKFEFSQAEKTKMLNLHAEGKYFSEIAKALGRTIMPVRRICAELGLQTSNSRRIPVGKKFGYLIVISEAAPKLNYQGHMESRSRVRCHCGEEKIVSNFNLLDGNTRTCGCKLHLVNPDTPYIRIFHSYLAGAKRRKFEMKLSIAQFRHLVHMRCFYCDAEFSNYQKGRKHGRSDNKIGLAYLGIDRVDSAKHYYPGNVLPACKMCNLAKSNASLSDFVAWLRRLGSDLDEQKILQGAAKLGLVLQQIR
jgi:hypothetical protein